MRALIAVALAGLACAPLAAQQRSEPPRYQGFWIGFGVGGGANLDETAADARAGGAGYLRMGGTINQQLVIGGEASGWARDVDAGTVSRANLTGTVYFYPAQGNGFFLKSGLGFAAAQFETTQGNATLTISDEGFGATFGAGYDFRLGSNFFITPNADLLVQVINDDTVSLLLLTVGVSWH